MLGLCAFYLLGSSYKVPAILVRFSLNLNFLGIFSKNTQIPNSMKIRPVGGPSCSMWTGGQTKMQGHNEANSRFSQFCERTYNYGSYQAMQLNKPLHAVRHTVRQCLSTFVRPRHGKFFFHKKRARSQQI